MLKEKYNEIETIKRAVRLVDLEGLKDITVETKDMVLLINYINTLQAVKIDNEKKISHLVNASLNGAPKRLDMYM